MKRRMLNIMGIGIAILVVLVVAVGLFFWYSMGQPTYRPGMVRTGKNLRGPLAPPAQPEDEQFWAVEEDIRLYHFSEGQGRPVLMVHGGPGYPFVEPWPGLDPLTGEYTFHYYDQRGCGRSTRPIDRFDSQNQWENIKTLDQTLGIGAQVADIERIRRILGEEKLIIVGNSFGGFLASLYAAEFPERVEALVLVAPADVLVMPQEDGGLFEVVRERLPEELQEEYTTYIDEYLDFKGVFSKSDAQLAALNLRFAEFYAAAFDLSDQDQPEVPEQGEPGGWMVQGMYFSMGRRHDYRAALAEVEAPVLVVHGSEDFQTEAASRTYVEAFPNGQFEVIPGGTHFVFYDRPEAFGEVVGRFLGELGSR